MHPLVTLGIIALVPAVVFLAVQQVASRLSQLERLPWQRPQPTPANRSLELLAGDLRRLDGQYHQTMAGSQMAKHARLKAISLAYDDTLRECCTVLEVPLPKDPPFHPFERLQVEAELARHGLTW